MAISRLQAGGNSDFRALLALFAEAFGDREGYLTRQPSEAYIQGLLINPNIIMLVSKDAGVISGGLVAYVLNKFEQERSEIYIYDLAVKTQFRRKGIATQLIQTLREIGREIQAYVIFVQADKGEEDVPAINLYNKLGIQEDVFHFDIKV